MPLSPTARASVWAHLRMCVLCRRYAKQTQVVAALARRLARIDAAGGPADALSPAMEQQLARLIRESDHPGQVAG